VLQKNLALGYRSCDKPLTFGCECDEAASGPTLVLRVHSSTWTKGLVLGVVSLLMLFHIAPSRILSIRALHAPNPFPAMSTTAGRKARSSYA